MLQKLREKTTGGWLAFIIVGALIIPFAFFGVNNYFTPGVATYAAKVGEVEISPEAFRMRFERYRQEQRQQLGERFDPRAFEGATVRREVLDRMIDEELFVQAAEQAGFVVAPNQLRDAIAEIPAFQVEGRFDPIQYRLLLSAEGMSPRMFEQRMERDLRMRSLPVRIAGTAFVADAELDDFIRLANQTRDIAYLAIAAPDTESRDVSDEQARDWYERNRERYLTEETVQIEYIEVDADSIKVASTVDDETLRQRYEEQRARFVEAEQRLASHILVAVPAEADAAADAAAKTKAVELAERARAGEDFAELAREHSDDVGSRAAGGGLGWIEAGLLGESFDEALFALEKGAIGEPIRSDSGWHVLRIEDVRGGRSQPFEEVRDMLAEQYLEGERERAYSELSGRLVDLSYRDPTSLGHIADTLGLEAKTAGPFGRGGGEGVAALSQVTTAAFSRQVLEDELTSDPIDLGTNRMLILRVLEHQPARARPLEEVRERIEAEIHRQRVDDAARERAEALLARAREGESFDTLAESAGAAPQQVEALGRFAGSPDYAIVERAFSLPRPEEGVDSLGLAELGPGNFVLVRVLKTTDGDPTAVPQLTRDAIRSQLVSAQADLELRAYLDALRKRIPVLVAEQQL